MRSISLSRLAAISAAALAVPLLAVGPAFAFPEAFHRPTGPVQHVGSTPSATAVAVGGTDGPRPAIDPSKAQNPGSQTPAQTPKPVTRCVTKRRTKTCRVYMGTQLLRSCTTKGRKGHRVKTCRIYNEAGKLASVCIKRSLRRVRCHRVNTTNAQSASLLEEGWNNTVIPQMVRIYLDGYGHCSGTLLTRGWSLMAGHCVHDGYKGGGYISPGRLKVVPGNSASNGLRTKPYGEYLVRRVLAADGWESVTQLGQDWGMIEVYPNGSGYYPGDYTGTYRARPGMLTLTRARSCRGRAIPASRPSSTPSMAVANTSITATTTGRVSWCATDSPWACTISLAMRMEVRAVDRCSGTTAPDGRSSA